MHKYVLILCVCLFVLPCCKDQAPSSTKIVRKAKTLTVSDLDAMMKDGAIESEPLIDEDVDEHEEELEERPKETRDWRERVKPGERTEVTWDDLYEFDHEKGIQTPFLKAINTTSIKIPGFVVPLTDGDVDTIKEFLIVPEPMMCIHVPPPPPNLLIYGTAQPAISVKSLWEPLWFFGDITIEKKESSYAEAGFTMKVTAIEAYVEED